MDAERITCECAHSEADIRAELHDVMWDGGITLGELVVYWSGGDMPHGRTEADMAAASAAIHRIGEMIAHDGEPDAQPYNMPTPEWVADIVCGAMAAVPTLAWDDALWRWPMVRLLHARLARYRMSGVATRRPDNMDAALEMLRQRNAARAANGGNHG